MPMNPQFHVNQNNLMNINNNFNQINNMNNNFQPMNNNFNQMDYNMNNNFNQINNMNNNFQPMNNMNNNFNQINNMNNTLTELNDYKSENLKLKEQINNLLKENSKLNIDLQNANKMVINIQQKEFVYINEINDLKIKLKDKEIEINNLTKKISNEGNLKKFVDFKNIMFVNFISSDGKINHSINCLKTDTFAEVEEKLYQIYDKYRETNNTFLLGGNIIKRFKKMSENNIKNGDSIQLQVQ